MDLIWKKSDMPDNGGRRRGIDRREFSYSDHIPERRVLQDRRSGFDRRSGLDRRQDQTPAKEFLEMRSGIERRRDWRA